MDEEVPEIDIAELAERREAGAVVLDVRELDEWTEARIPGVIHVPLTELVERVGEVPTDTPLLVVCAMGGRSRNACEYLRTRGIDATNVDGGTRGGSQLAMRWKAVHDVSLPSDRNRSGVGRTRRNSA